MGEARHSTEESSRPLLVYVVGSGRSGSSLLDALLNGFEDIAGCGELHRLSIKPGDRLCSCGTNLNECSHWSSVRSRLTSFDLETWADLAVDSVPRSRKEELQRRFLAALAPMSLFPGPRTEFTRRYRRAIHNTDRLIDAVGAETGSACVVDSTKNPMRLLAYATWGRHRMKCIYIMRDGRAVAYSQARRGASAWLPALLKWHVDQVKVRTAIRKSGLETHVVTYERLCLDPNGTLASIREFLGLPLLELPPLLNVEQHLIPGNPMLFSGFPRVLEDTEWRRQTSKAKSFWFFVLSVLFGQAGGGVGLRGENGKGVHAS